MKKPPNRNKSGTDWEVRFNCNREPEVKVLEKAFAGIPAGSRMLVVTPSVFDAAVMDIPFGMNVDAARLRQTLAATYGPSTRVLSRLGSHFGWWPPVSG